MLGITEVELLKLIADLAEGEVKVHEFVELTDLGSEAWFWAVYVIKHQHYLEPRLHLAYEGEHSLLQGLHPQSVLWLSSLGLEKKVFLLLWGSTQA